MVKPTTLCCTALLVCALITGTLGLPLWQRNLGDVGMGTNTMLLSTDASVVYSLWSANAWASRPTYFLLAIRVTTGSVVWNGTLYGSTTVGLQCQLAQNDRMVFVTSIYTGQVAALWKNTGDVAWLVMPFANNYLTTHGTVPLGDDMLLVVGTYSTVIFNATTGVDTNTTVRVPSGALPIVVVHATGPMMYFKSSCYTVAANGSTVMVWSYPSTTFPSIVAADADIAVVVDQANTGVPRISALDASNGSVLWAHQVYNSQYAYGWAAIAQGNVVTEINGVLQYFNQTGGVVWEVPFANSTGTQVLLDALYVVVLMANQQARDSPLWASLVHLPTGTISEQRTILSTFDPWYQSTQLVATTDNLVVAYSSNSQTTNNNYETLIAQSLAPAPPIGVVVQTFAASVDCTGPFKASVVSTGCVDEGGALDRTCGGNTVTVKAFNGSTCSGAAASSNTYVIGQCVPFVDASFRVASCSSS